MSVNRQTEPGSPEGKKLTAFRAFPYFLAVLVVLPLLGYVLWGTGTTPHNP